MLRHARPRRPRSASRSSLFVVARLFSNTRERARRSGATPFLVSRGVSLSPTPPPHRAVSLVGASGRAFRSRGTRRRAGALRQCRRPPSSPERGVRHRRPRGGEKASLRVRTRATREEQRRAARHARALTVERGGKGVLLLRRTRSRRPLARSFKPRGSVGTPRAADRLPPTSSLNQPVFDSRAILLFAESPADTSGSSVRW